SPFPTRRSSDLVGENAADVRAASLAGLERLGIAVDPERNRANAPVISPEGTDVTVCVIPTDEEKEIARQTRAVAAAPPADTTVDTDAVAARSGRPGAPTQA